VWLGFPQEVGWGDGKEKEVKTRSSTLFKKLFRDRFELMLRWQGLGCLVEGRHLSNRDDREG